MNNSQTVVTVPKKHTKLTLFFQQAACSTEGSPNSRLEFSYRWKTDSLCASKDSPTNYEASISFALQH